MLPNMAQLSAIRVITFGNRSNKLGSPFAVLNATAFLRAVIHNCNASVSSSVMN